MLINQIPLWIYHLPTVPIPVKVEKWTYWHGSIPAQVKACISLRKFYMGVKYFRVPFTENLLLIHKILTSKMPRASPCLRQRLHLKVARKTCPFYLFQIIYDNVTYCTEYLHKLVQFPWSSTEMTGARPNQAITQVFEGLLFNNEHILVSLSPVNTPTSIIICINGL